MHHFLPAGNIRLSPAYAGNSESFSRCSVVDGDTGSVHMGVGLCALAAGGRVDGHIHSFEESFYVLEGEPTLILDDHGYRLLPGAGRLMHKGRKARGAIRLARRGRNAPSCADRQAGRAGRSIGR